MLPMGSTLLTVLLQDELDAGLLGAFGALCGGGMSLLWLVIVAITIIGMWKLFAKAGQPGWASLIPIYNIYILLKMVGRPGIWLLFMLIPFLNIIFGIILMLDLAKSFGKGTGFAIGLILFSPIFMLILGFGSDEYLGPSATP